MKKTILLIVSFFLASTAFAAERRVSTPEYPTIQVAINACNDGDTVIVADGIYTGPGNRDIDFLGKAITVRSESGPENCIIDCENAGRGFYFHSNEDLNSVVEGFTIINGYTWSGPYGGGIYCFCSSPTITHCIINSNTAARDWSRGGGGGIFCGEGSPNISNCIISGNSANKEGGGIYCLDSNATIANCVINGNWTNRQDGGGSGGGIACGEGGNPTLINCTICDNSSDLGGGIYSVQYSSPYITNSTISGNLAAYEGGGICCRGTSLLTITNSTVSGNSAEDEGGGIYCRYSSPTITNCNITANEAGGGAGVYGCKGPITSCTITGNSARWGGGLHHCDGPITNCIVIGNTGTGIFACNGNITNCTISDNTEGGLFACNGWVTNCVIWNNTRDEIDSGHPVVSYSDIRDGYLGQGNIDAEPCFVVPGYWDVNDIWVDGDYHLLGGSPCIDTGDPNYVAGPNETDLDGNLRVVNGRIDMGAYEYVPPVEVELTLTPQMLNCESSGKWLKAHVTLPEEIYPEDIDVNTPAVADPPGVESEFIKVNEYSDGSFEVQIYFERQGFCEALSESEDGFLEVTITGSFIDGRKFQGSDTIKLKSKLWQHRIRKDINRVKTLELRKTKR